jgi:opacity protein-like surface antigen
MNKINKKLSPFIFIIMMITTTTHAQKIKTGLRFGISTSPTQAENLIVNGNTQQAISAKYGMHAGLFARFKLTALYIQPEVLLNTGTMQYQITDIATGATDTYKGSRYNIDIPVMCGIKTGPLRLQAGVVGSYTLQNLSEISDVQVFYNGFTYGYQAGVGIDIFKKIYIDAKYEGNLSGLGNGVVVGAQVYDFDARPARILLGVGYVF